MKIQLLVLLLEQRHLLSLKLRGLQLRGEWLTAYEVHMHASYKFGVHT
jgi:hypothetical protein